MDNLMMKMSMAMNKMEAYKKGEVTMKYFEIQDPYYATIKAPTKEEAVSVYIENVADDSPDEPLINEIKEISRDFALAKYARSTDEEGEIGSLHKKLERFKEAKASILTISSGTL